MKDFVLQEHKESQCTFAFIKTYHVAIEVYKTNSSFFFISFEISNYFNFPKKQILFRQVRSIIWHTIFISNYF